MGILCEAKLDEIVQAGCPSCGPGQLVFAAYLDARLLLLGGEPVGKLSFCYDGEKFVDGVYEITCGTCKKTLFSESVCPRCHKEGGLAAALSSENLYPRPTACPSCEAEEVRYTAFVPAVVVYEKRQATKARTEVDAYDPGFHGFRVECTDCGAVKELETRCPLCNAEGPLRPRPGE